MSEDKYRITERGDGKFVTEVYDDINRHWKTCQTLMSDGKFEDLKTARHALSAEISRQKSLAEGREMFKQREAAKETIVNIYPFTPVSFTEENTPFD